MVTPSATDIVVHTPIWVWGVAALLVALGALQLRTHRASPTRLLIAACAVAAYAAWGAMHVFGTTPMVAGWWLLGALGGAAAAHALGLPRGAERQADGRIRLVGSAWPLALYLLVFGVRYALGVAQAVAPAAMGQAAVVTGACLTLGAAAGMLATRALRARGTRATASLLATA